MKLRTQQLGVNLIELLVVIAIISFLALVAGPSLTQFWATQRIKTYASSLGHDIALARNMARTSGVPVQFVTNVDSKDGTLLGWSYIFASAASVTAGVDASQVQTATIGRAVGYFIVGCNGGASINGGAKFGFVLSHQGGIRVIEKTDGGVSADLPTVPANDAKILISSIATPDTRTIQFAPSGNISVLSGINKSFQDKDKQPQCS